MFNPDEFTNALRSFDADRLRRILRVFQENGKKGNSWTHEMNAVGVSLEYVRNQVALALFELRTQRQEDVSVSPKAIALDKLELVVESNMKSLLWDGSEGSSRDFHAVQMDLEPCANLGHEHLLVLIEKFRDHVFLHILITDWPLADELLKDFVPL